MQQSTIMLIILLIATILFLNKKVPILFTSMAAVLATFFTGVAEPADVFSGFSVSAVWSLIGISMASGAFKTTGLADVVGIKLFKLAGGNQKRVSLVIYLIAVLLCFLTPGVTVVLMLIPMIDALVTKSNGTLTKKMCYMPLGLGALLGGTLTLSGSANMLSASGMMEAVTGETFSYLTPFPIGLCIVACGVIYLCTFGPRIMTKVFEPELEVATALTETEANNNPTEFTPKMKLTALILIATVILLVWGEWGMPVVGFAATALLIITKCETPEEAINNVSWPIVIQIVCVLGLATSINKSGAGAVLGNLVLTFGQKLGFGPFGILVLFMLLCQLLSNFLSSKNACTGILVPIAISTAQLLGTNVFAYTLATVIAVNTAYLTPICCPLINLTMQGGYRFSDYFKANWILNAMTFLATVIAFKFIYFM